MWTSTSEISYIIIAGNQKNEGMYIINKFMLNSGTNYAESSHVQDTLCPPEG